MHAVSTRGSTSIPNARTKFIYGHSVFVCGLEQVRGAFRLCALLFKSTVCLNLVYSNASSHKWSVTSLDRLDRVRITVS